MSGGGVTPFSPTPWKFDTGTTSQTMGLNCVAGTTEYDEDEGIGLVLYTNSEGQLIVWKMSNGTKQGTAVPLTTDYQSMLKSEFENKTGITIGYIIIHPYTEETIDIESSITINSGDTPLINAKIKIPNGEFFFIGEIINSVFNPYCMPNSGDNNTLWETSSNGQIREGNNNYTGGFKTWLDNKVKTAGYEITGGEGLKKALEVGSTINLNEYETIQ